MTFHIPSAKAIFFPKIMLMFVLPAFSLLASLIPNLSEPNSDIHSEDLLKELDFGSGLNRTEQPAGCFPLCGRHFCPLSRLKYSDRLKEKWVISRCVAGAVEQGKWQGPELCNRSQQGQSRAAEPPLSDLPWEAVWAAVHESVSLPHSPQTGFSILEGPGAKVILQKCCFFYFPNSGADKSLPWSKKYNFICDIWGNVIYIMEIFLPVFNVQVCF